MNDTAFNALAREPRRALLLSLLEESPRADIAPSASDAGSVQTVQRAELELYHSHLPKLDDYGFIRWDTDAEEIRRGPQFEEIRPLLECVATHTDH